ncbi:MAG: redoxin family protein [Rhizobiales bacterium]|nr:redoxin family protein [Hyphomicrobiales bacterium]
MAPGSKLQAGSEFPALSMPKVGGGELTLGGPGRWQAIVIYRGKHCPLCRKYLKSLDNLLDEFAKADIGVIAASADPSEKAETEAAEEGWRFPIGYGLTLEQMRTLGLYISDPRSPQETDRPFAEPGLFVVNADGKVQVVDISNAPYARPDLAGLLSGIKNTREKNNPIRGTKS